MRPVHFALCAVVTLVVPAPARADAPGPRPVCGVEGLSCELCWRPYGAAPETDAAFAKCRDTQMAKGLVQACDHRQGAGDNVYFCPEGVSPKKAVRGGCAGCDVGSSGGSAPLAALALCLGVFAWQRRRARPRRATRAAACPGRPSR